MNAQDVLGEILEDLGLKIKQFANEIGYPVGKLYDIQRGKTKRFKDDLVEIISDFYPKYSRVWLLTGEGPMLSNKQEVSKKYAKPSSDTLVVSDTQAHYTSQASTLGELLEGQYVVPEFIAAQANVIFRLSGNDLAPRYCRGDIVACRKLSNSTFIQWGKLYAIDTKHGVIVRRIFEHPTSTKHLLCKSENDTTYPQFVIQYSDIKAIYMVIGAICLE